MQVSHLHKLILIENPRCANRSFAHMLQAEPLEQFARFANAADLKKDGGLPPEFEDYGVVVLVRNPLDRFVSAVRLTISKPCDEFTPEEVADYGGKAFENLALHLSDFQTLTSATEATIDWLKTTNDWPTIFKSQLTSLAGSPDLVISVSKAAAFANAHPKFERGFTDIGFDQGLSLQVPYIAAEFRQALNELLSEDVSSLKMQPVWSPQPNVRLTALGGGCGGCGKTVTPEPVAPVLEVAFPKDEGKAPVSDAAE
jgi:hypothetical protein